MTRPPRPIAFLAGTCNARNGMVQGLTKAARTLSFLEDLELAHCRTWGFLENEICRVMQEALQDGTHSSSTWPLTSPGMIGE